LVVKERWLDLETAKKVLKNFDIFREDPSGKADFLISSKDAIILSIYTNAFFLYNERFGIKFNPMVGGLSYQEHLQLKPHEADIYRTNEVIPILSFPISKYLELFPAFGEQKYLFLVEPHASKSGWINTEYSIQELMKRIKDNGLNPLDCIVWFSGLEQSYGEDFWEYVAGLTLREQGHFVGYYTIGGGDVYAYYIPEYLKQFIEKGLLTKGAFLEELQLFPLNQTKSKNFEFREIVDTACIEAESTENRTRSHAQGSGIGQLMKYIYSSSFYTKGFVTGPFCKKEEFDKEDVGLVSCDENGNIVFKESKHFWDAKPQHIDAIKTLIKSALLFNLSTEERFDLVSEIIGQKIKPQLHEYFESIPKADIGTIIEKLKINI
jgi:hypothetical protein